MGQYLWHWSPGMNLMNRKTAKDCDVSWHDWGYQAHWAPGILSWPTMNYGWTVTYVIPASHALQLGTQGSPWNIMKHPQIWRIQSLTQAVHSHHWPKPCWWVELQENREPLLCGGHHDFFFERLRANQKKEGWSQLAICLETVMTFQDKVWQMLTSSRQPQLICASFGPLENMGHGCHGMEEDALIFLGSPGDWNCGSYSCHLSLGAMAFPKP